MSGSVTRCLDCGGYVWADSSICPKCHSNNIAASLSDVVVTLCKSDTKFQKKAKRHLKQVMEGGE